jgi:hypothetical protein
MRRKHDRLIGNVTRLAWGLLATLAVSGACGCTAFQGVNDYLAYNDSVNDFVLGWRNSVWARQAWHERKGQFYGQPYFSAFGTGFRAGYENVASGGNGCPPAIPPRDFWTWKYQNPEGQAQVAAWFAGFPYGARAAEEDGAGLYQQIQLSSEIERQYSPEFNGRFINTEDLPPVNAAPIINEPLRGSPLPNLQDAPPPLNPQTRTDRGWPAFAESPPTRTFNAAGPPVPVSSGVAPAAYFEPEAWNAAAAPPATVPAGMPAALSAPDPQAARRAPSR